MRSLLMVLLAAGSVIAADPMVVPLWPSGAPGSEGKTGEESVRTTGNGEVIVSGIHQPSITVWLPSGVMSTGAAIVIAPGGGHRLQRSN